MKGRQPDQEGRARDQQHAARAEQDEPRQRHPPLPRPAVGEQPAEQRQRVDHRGEQPESLRREAERRQRTVDRLQRGAIGADADDLFDMPGQEQPLRHVERQQRLDAGIADVPAPFDRREIAEPDRVAEEALPLRAHAPSQRATIASITSSGIGPAARTRSLYRWKLKRDPSRARAASRSEWMRSCPILKLHAWPG